MELPERQELCDKVFSLVGSTVFLFLWVMIEQWLPYIDSIDGNSLFEIIDKTYHKYNRNRVITNPFEEDLEDLHTIQANQYIEDLQDGLDDLTIKRSLPIQIGARSSIPDGANGSGV